MHPSPCTSAMDEKLYKLLSETQNKLFEFYKVGKLTDVTWIVGPENDKVEYIDAHSSICSLSTRLKELLLAHPKTLEKRHIAIPSFLTSSASDFRSLLHLAYTGTLEKGRSLHAYIGLCEIFDMPLGLNTCLRFLKNFLHGMLLSPTVNSDVQREIREFFVYSIDDFKDESFNQTMLNFLRIHPFIFDTQTCLAKVSIEWIKELLQEGSLWMQHPNGYVCFGEKYLNEITQFIDHLCTAQNIKPFDIKIKSHNSMFAPLHVSHHVSPTFGHHNTYAHNYNFRAFEGTHCTHDSYPPNEWKICALTGYITKDWDGRHLLAGFDVTYRNMTSGMEKTAEWGRHDEDKYTIQTISVPEDDILTGFEINAGWLIDRLTFITREGTRLGPLGTSDGGEQTALNVSNFLSWEEPDNVEDVLVSLHGFSYNEIMSHGQILWNEVQFHFASVDRPLVQMLNPGEKDVCEILRSKKILM